MGAARSLSVQDCLHPSHSSGSSPRPSSHQGGALPSFVWTLEYFVSNKTALLLNRVSPSCHLVQPALFMNSSNSPNAKIFFAKGAELILWSGLHTIHNIFSFIYVKGSYPGLSIQLGQEGQGIGFLGQTGLEILGF